MEINVLLLKSSGILMDKALDDKLIYIPNDDNQSYHLISRFKLFVEKVWTQLVILDSIRLLKFLNQLMKKRNNKTLCTSIILVQLHLPPC